jgi:hypothetical protein
MTTMSHIRLFHWKADESAAFRQSLRAAGHQVDYDEKLVPGLLSKVRKSPPEAIVIVLSRLPSHGRELATYLRGSKATRHIPIVFVDGAADKVDGIRRHIPDAAYTSLENLPSVLRRAIANPPSAPVVPVQMMERYGARTTAQKLGIVKDSTVALFDPPRDYESVLGPMPEGVAFQECGDGPVTLWFVHDAAVYQSRLPRARSLASRTKLWILWQKGGRQTGISEPFIRETATAMGLVDYKICSVNDRWSAMAFARKKA